MNCKICGKQHDATKQHSRRLISKLSDKGFPVHAKSYDSAHRRANEQERKRYPKGYEELKRIDAKLGKHELAGKNTKTGVIEVSKKVPAKLRTEVAFHEKVENKILRKKGKK